MDSVVALRVSEGQRAGVQEEKGFGFLWPLLMPIARLRPPEIEMDSQTEGGAEEEEGASMYDVRTEGGRAVLIYPKFANTQDINVADRLRTRSNTLKSLWTSHMDAPEGEISVRFDSGGRGCQD